MRCGCKYWFRRAIYTLHTHEKTCYIPKCTHTLQQVKTASCVTTEEGPERSKGQCAVNNACFPNEVCLCWSVGGKCSESTCMLCTAPYTDKWTRRQPKCVTLAVIQLQRLVRPMHTNANTNNSSPPPPTHTHTDHTQHRHLHCDCSCVHHCCHDHTQR